MDVNATLERLRSAVRQWNLAANTDDALHAASEMAEAQVDLDRWMSSGGFLPTDWLAPRVERALGGE